MADEITYVIGHKNPDTDSICSAIGLAELKRATGMMNVHAARAGHLNPQTSFVLERLGLSAPKYLTDVLPRAEDVMSNAIVTVSDDTPLVRAMEEMKERRVRFVPVVDASEKFVGVLTLADLARRYIDTVEGGTKRVVSTSVKAIAETLGAEVLLDFISNEDGSNDPGQAVKESNNNATFRLYVAAMSVESFLSKLDEEGDLAKAVVVGDRVKVQKGAIEHGVKLLIVSGGFSVPEEVMQEARKNRVSIMVSPHDSATTALLVRLSTPAGSIASRDFERALPGELVDDLKYRLAASDGMVVLDEDEMLQGVITKTDLIRPSRTNLILVDHNELSQAVDGAASVNILEVVDHHRIGDFQSTYAISFVCEPVGATSTLVAELFKRSGKPIGKDIAALLLGGVLSDTVILKSPTTTAKDVKIVKWLEAESGLSFKEFGREIFAATSSIRKRGIKGVVGGDHKIFQAGVVSFGIGQVETIGFTEFYEEMEGLRDELLRVMNERGLALSALIVTDIVLGDSLLLAVGEKKVLYNLGYPRLDAGLYELRKVISRKKQVVPHILGVFDELY